MRASARTRMRVLWRAAIAVLMMAGLLVGAAGERGDAATDSFVVHSDGYDAGWYIDSGGERRWLSVDCRTEAEARGAVFQVTPWGDIATYPAASGKKSCSEVLTEAGLAGAQAVQHTKGYDAGWVLDGNNRFWVDSTCKDQLAGAGVWFDIVPFGVIQQTPLSGVAGAAGMPTCDDLGALFGEAAPTPLPAAPPSEPPAPLDGRYVTDMLGTEVTFTAAPGSLAVVRAPNSLIIIDTVNAQTPSTEAILLLRLSAFADAVQAVDQPLPGPAYGGPNGFPFNGGTNVDDWLNALPEVQVANRTDTTISGYPTTMMDLTVDSAGRTGLGEVGCGPGSGACFGFATAPSPAVPSLVVRSSEHYRVAVIDQGSHDPILIFAPGAPGNAAFMAGVDAFIASLDIGPAAPSIDLSQPMFWESGGSGPVPAGPVNLPTAGGISFVMSIDTVVVQNSAQSFGSIVDAATGDQQVALFTPTGIDGGPAITTAAEFFQHTSGCNYIPAPEVTILGRTVQGYAQTTPETCEPVSLAPAGQPPTLDEVLFATPAALNANYAFDTPIGVVVIAVSADTPAAIPGAVATLTEFIGSLNMVAVPPAEAPPWERGLPGDLPAGVSRINFLGGMEIDLSAGGVFVDPFLDAQMVMFPETGSVWLGEVGGTGPGAPYMTTAGELIAHIGTIGDITLSPLPDSTLLGGPAKVFDFTSVSSDPGFPFVDIFFHEDAGPFGLPPVGRLWIAETSRGLLVMTAEGFDSAELAPALALAAEVEASATFISGLPPRTEQGFFGFFEAPPPAKILILGIDPGVTTPLMVGDAIVAVNGVPVLLVEPVPGPAVLTVERNGQLIDLNVELPPGDPLAGFQFELVFPDGPPPDEIEIIEVIPVSSADLAGIVPGDLWVSVDGTPWFMSGPFAVGDTYDVEVRTANGLETFQLTAVPFPQEGPPPMDGFLAS